MSFLETLLISICRSSLMACISLGLAQPVYTWILTAVGSWRTLRWGLVMSPFFTPGLLVGFCYRDTRLNLSHLPVLNESLYFLLTLGMTLPICVMLLHLLPLPAASVQALHMARLIPDRQIGHWKNRCMLLRQGPWGRRFLAAVGVFLVSFQEAEVASLLRTCTWTEWLFTMQAGGLVNPVRYLLWIVPIELLCIVLLLPYWVDRRPFPAGVPSSQKSASCGTFLAYLWVGLSLIFVTVIPVSMLIYGAARGVGIIFQQPSFPREIFDALLLALTGSILTLTILHGTQAITHRPLRRLLLTMGAIPGLFGALSLGLGLAAIFQTDFLNAAYDTPGPLVLGILLYLLPRGIIVGGSLLAVTRREDHLARIVRSSGRRRQQEQGLELCWALQGQRWYWVSVLLFFWAYFELMLPSILAPPGMAPAPLLLYNALHYGRMTALATKLLVTMAVPVCLLSLIWLCRRPLLRRFI